MLLDPDDRILLIQCRDPADPRGATWWEIPGGGMDPGERSADTALRELREEGGILSAEIGPVVWVQSVQFTFAGLHFDQDEFIHVARTTQTELGTPTLELFEAMAFQGARWWTCDEVVAATTPFLPPRLPELLPALVAGTYPDPPLDISPT